MKTDRNKRRLITMSFLLVGIFLGIIISMFLFNDKSSESNRNQEHERLLSFCQEINPNYTDVAPLSLDNDVDDLGEFACFTRDLDGTISSLHYYTQSPNIK